MVVSVDNVVRGYAAGEPILKGVNLEIRKGEVVGLLGRNGAGKTTLIRLIMGMLQPQKGTVRIFGLDPLRNGVEVKRRIGYLSEDQTLPAGFRVGEVLELHRRLYPSWRKAAEEELTGRFGIRYDARIKSLSKGQARQVALLCAVAHSPELLVLDEPAGGLDPAARRQFLETAVRLLVEEGTTVLFSSHNMQDVERLAGRLVLLEGGQVLVDDELDRVRESHNMPLEDLFIKLVGGPRS